MPAATRPDWARAWRASTPWCGRRSSTAWPRSKATAEARPWRAACGPRPIDANAAERAIGRLTAEYSRSIPEQHFPLLAEVYKVKRCKNDDDHRLMLHNLSVLEYMNGLEPWHDVHPSVQRLAKFREARDHA